MYAKNKKHARCTFQHIACKLLPSRILWNVLRSSHRHNHVFRQLVNDYVLTLQNCHFHWLAVLPLQQCTHHLATHCHFHWLAVLPLQQCTHHLATLREESIKETCVIAVPHRSLQPFFGFRSPADCRLVFQCLHVETGCTRPGSLQ